MNKLSVAIRRDLSTFIVKIFKKNLEFAFICGKIGFGVFNSNSDIDIVVVLRDKFVENPQKFLPTKRMFMEEYFNLHKKYGLKPDYLWPGEYVSVTQMQEAALGKAIEIKDRDLSPPYLVENNELGNDKIYSYWWSMLIFSEFLLGDKIIYSELRKKATATLIQLALYNKKLEKITNARSFIKLCINSYTFLGIDSAYQNYIFFKNVTPVFNAALNFLTTREVLIKKKNGYIVTNNLASWANGLLKKTKNTKWKTSISKSYYL